MKKIATIFLAIIWGGGADAAIRAPQATGRPGTAPVAMQHTWSAEQARAANINAVQARDTVTAVPIAGDLGPMHINAEIDGQTLSGLATADVGIEAAMVAAARGRALEACRSLDDGMRSLLILTGVTVGAGVVGVGAGAAGAVTGFMQTAEDRDNFVALMANQEGISEVLTVREERFDASIGQMEDNMTPDLAVQQEADVLFFEGLQRAASPQDRVRFIAANTDRADMELVSQRSQVLGQVATVSTFAAGGANVIAAGTAITARVTADFDQIRQDMGDCEAFARQVVTDPNVLRSCQGFNAQNIDVIRNNLAIAGVVSVLGGAAGIYGGVRSMHANQIDPTTEVEAAVREHLQMHRNVAAIVSGGAGLVSGLVTGVPLINMQRNARIARDCIMALERGM